ncbi:MAG: 5-oxoprolinase subunit PxpB [Spirochaetia bacterium]|nr:5-oxoprolinase subunit PxpB [Spirochaetia bacterium]
MDKQGEYEIQFHIAGDSAISIELGDVISLEVNSRVRALRQVIEERSIPGITEMVPTYTNLIIHYRPEQIRYSKLEKLLRQLVLDLKPIDFSNDMVIEIPILYGGDSLIDLQECAERQKVSVNELIRMHSQSLYYTYMLGFAPGHPYLARFENPFSFKRRECPRVKIPAGSVVVAENLSNLIPFDQPCGWNIIGHTPVKIFDAFKQPPSLVNAGDWVKFVPISKEEFDSIKEQVKLGKYACKRYPKESKQR